MNDTPPNPVQSPWWDRDRLASRLPKLKARNAIAGALRGWFAEEGFVEVETPALQISPGLEPHLAAFETKLFEPFEETGRQLYLHTSPEYAMKKLLAGGMQKIFQLARCYRNGERSATHHPEFTMLEWYRAQADWRHGAADTEALIRAGAAAHGVSDVTRDGVACDLSRPFRYLSVAEAFSDLAGADVLATLDDPERPGRDALAEMAARAGVRVAAYDGWDVIFDRILLEKIEPHLGAGEGTVLYDYPAPLAALAKKSDSDPRLADRFEVYVCGMELANGFGELTDAVEQRRRFESDRARKQSMGDQPYPMDEDFLAALEAGLPNSTGVAMGFDRLVMLLTGADLIEDVLWAPVVTAR